MKVVLKNSGGESIKLLGVPNSCNTVSITKLPLVVPSHSECEIRMKVKNDSEDSKEQSGRLSGNLRVWYQPNNLRAGDLLATRVLEWNITQTSIH